MAIPDLEQANFEEFLSKSDNPVAVLFWGSWSQACSEVMPVFENLKRQFVRELSFAKVNIASNQALADKLNVRAVPAIVFFNAAGKPVSSISGVYSLVEFRDKFNVCLKML